jgi:hypothetical protein
MGLYFFDAAMLAQMNAACSAAGAKVNSADARFFSDLVEGRTKDIGPVVVQPKHLTVRVWKEKGVLVGVVVRATLTNLLGRKEAMRQRRVEVRDLDSGHSGRGCRRRLYSQKPARKLRVPETRPVNRRFLSLDEISIVLSNSKKDSFGVRRNSDFGAASHIRDDERTADPSTVCASAHSEVRCCECQAMQSRGRFGDWD